MFVFDCNDILFDQTESDSVYNQAEDYELSEEFIKTEGELIMSQSNYIFKQNLVSSSKYSIKCPFSMAPRYVVVHNTYNDASAENEVNYMINNNNQVSFHIACDDVNVIQGLPLNRNAWHATDGASGQGNRYGIGVEICYSKSGGARYTKAEENAVYVCARLLHQHGLGIESLKQHHDFALNGKNCPHRIRDEGRWEGFKGRVNWVLGEIKAGRCDASLSSGTTYAKPAANQTVSKPTTNTSTSTNYVVRVTADSLNVRKGPSVSYSVVGELGKGEAYTIVATQNGWGKLKSGVGWINLSYTQRVSNAPASTPSSSQLVKVTAYSLNVRKGPGVSYPVTGSVKKGDVFTIVATQNGWGKLKSGAGWISLGYTQKL